MGGANKEKMRGEQAADDAMTRGGADDNGKP